MTIAEQIEATAKRINARIGPEATPDDVYRLAIAETYRTAWDAGLAAAVSKLDNRIGTYIDIKLIRDDLIGLMNEP